MEQGATDLSRISFEEEAEQARIGSKKKNIFGGKEKIFRPISKGTGAPQLSRVANQFLAASGKQISRKTVARRLRGGGELYAHELLCVCPLTEQHRTARLQ
ncbi:hypothetical protein TNCV_801431 [Trichonephila clavipes]|nr:hypothetical protein TNCV_801431 [Trichonephila clavipes]